MAINFGDAAMAFGSGVIEADAKNTKENLLIRGEELKAKRDAILANLNIEEEREAMVALTLTRS